MEFGFYITYTLIIFLICMSVVVHEMGHWIILSRFKIKAVEMGFGLGLVLFDFGYIKIRLLPLGAYVVPEPVSYSRLTPLEKGLVAVAGPFINVLYGFMLYYGFVMYGYTSLEKLAFLNWAIAAINLVPLPPLDGWILAQTYFKSLTTRFEKIAYRIGNSILYGFGFYLLGKIILP